MSALPALLSVCFPISTYILPQSLGLVRTNSSRPIMSVPSIEFSIRSGRLPRPTRMRAALLRKRQKSATNEMKIAPALACLEKKSNGGVNPKNETAS